MKTAFILVLSLLFLICACAFQQHAPYFLTQIRHSGWLAPLLFILIYCFATILFLPTMVLTLAGGVLFGTLFGTLLNLSGATLGAVCAFGISRYFAYNWLSRHAKIKSHQLIRGVEKRGWQFAALLRLIPIIPFNLVNYGLGMTSIKFSQYLFTTAVFLTPGEIIYTYCGHAGMDVLINQHSPFNHPKIMMISAGLLIATLAIGVKMSRWFKQKL